MNSSLWAVWAAQAVRKKVDLSYSDQLLCFFLFFLKKLKKVEKIGYHSNSNFECNTERGSIE